MAEPLRLYGLNALVTSAGNGIGEAVARTLVKHGATVLAVDGLNSGVERHFSSVRGIHGLAAELRDAGRIPALIEAAVEQLGTIDIVINEYPLQPETPIGEPGPALEQLLETRAELIMAMCRGVLPYLKKSPAGRIVNIGFLRNIFSAGGTDACARAEADLQFGITANYVQPGAIMTAASREVFRKDKTLRDYCISNSAAKRLGEPVDVAKVVLFLTSDDAVFVSGTGIAVDGGRVDA
jgi:NAD(P)-dependent dehydrogenase (short-subunit alcohol dehydrogenase family)